MIVNKRITIDLLASGKVDTVQTVQGDAYSRAVEIDLRQGRKPWAIPDGVSVMVEYVKPDGTKGLYDTLPDGTQAWSADGNILTIHIAPQMLTANGSVATQVSITKDSARLSLFKFWVYVNQKIHGEDSEDYINWRSAFLPQVENAKAGQYFEIEEVDSAGRAVKVKAVDAPQGGSSQADWNAAEGEPGHVLNRTHWVESEGASDTVEWDGDLTGREIAVDSEEGGEFGVVKLSDCYLTMEQLDGAVLTLTSPDGDETVTLSVEMMTDTSEMLGVPGVAVNEYLFSLSDSVTLGGMALTRGLWGTFMTSEGQTIAYIKSIKATAPIFGSETIHKLDNKFIDAEWMATGGQEQYEGDILQEVEFTAGDITSGTDFASYPQCVGLGKVKEGDRVMVVWDRKEFDLIVKYTQVELFGTAYPALYAGNAGGVFAEIGATPSIPDTGEPFAITFGSTNVDSGEFNDSCIVNAANEEGLGTHTVSIYAKRKLQTLPDKYIPTTVPVIQTATPGQTIVVKSVDSDGKPTEWEVTDLPDSSQNGDELELVVNLEISESVKTISINEDMDGNELKLKEMVLFMEFYSPSDTSTGNAHGYTNKPDGVGAALSNPLFFTAANGTNGRLVWVHIDAKTGKMLRNMGGWTNNQSMDSNVTTTSIPHVKNNILSGEELITSLFFNAPNAFEPGTKIQIYGVKA